MTARKSFQVLCVIDLLLIGIYALYVVLPDDSYLGYYPIGIVQIILLVGALTALILYIRNRLTIKNIGILDGVLLAGYTLSILFMSYGIFIWYAFMPR